MTKYIKADEFYYPYQVKKAGILLESKVLVLLYPNLVKKRSLNFQILKIPQQSKML